jgi:hypothetical protein
MYNPSFPGEYKMRPAVIILEESEGEYLVCPITGTNRTGKVPGIWVTATSPAGQQMGLTKDSFIVARTQLISKLFIGPPLRPLGYCPLIDDLEALLSDT